MNKITIIVPIYQVEDYIVECARSLVSQTNQQFDVIFVNDQTPDRSILFLEEYLQSSDPKFNWTIIHNQKNLGLSASRNKGISFADTEFVMFLDSDDFIDPVMFEKILGQNDLIHGDIDIICYGFQLFNGIHIINSGTVKSTAPTFYTSDEAILAMFGNGDIDISACSKIFKSSLFKNTNIQFPVGVYYEDVLTVCKLVQKANKIVVIPYNFYTYRCARVGSIMNTYSEKHLRDNLGLMYDLELFFQEESSILLSQEYNSDKFINVIEELLKLSQLYKQIDNNGMTLFNQLQGGLALYYKRLDSNRYISLKFTLFYYYFRGSQKFLKWNYFRLNLCFNFIKLVKKLRK
ncbi:glycosyltransferase family 2 protein [Sphingobacterium anhuiense]|uniref:Glycosyltransferase family 2 protein n=1 Tax=Sphingobacterium anhuiense TaxID=493780 RepID=A0ABW5Z0M8_9SPHI